MSGAVTKRMARPDAIAIAKRFVALIEDATDRLTVAGSLRRCLASIGDIEIVAVPATGQRATDMFGDVMQSYDLLTDRLERLLADGTIQKRPRSDGAFFWGPSAKYLTFDGAPVDLFSPCAERFGMILVIRTGPSDFSNALVTPRGVKTRKGRNGLMPPIYRQQGGWLTYRTSGERIPTPTEQSVFDLFGLPYQEPWERV